MAIVGDFAMVYCQGLIQGCKLSFSLLTKLNHNHISHNKSKHIFSWNLEQMGQLVRQEGEFLFRVPSSAGKISFTFCDSLQKDQLDRDALKL